MNCDGVRSDRFTIGLVSPRPWRWDVPQGFQHGGSREDVEGHGAEFIAPRAKRFEPLYYSVASTSSPANSVLKFFLNCGRHTFPRLSKARGIQAIDLRFTRLLPRHGRSGNPTLPYGCVAPGVIGCVLGAGAPGCVFGAGAASGAGCAGALEYGWDGV